MLLVANDHNEEQCMEQVLKGILTDDPPLILQGLRRTLGACDDIDVVGEARTGSEVVPLVQRRRPDVVVLDLHMPGMDGAPCIAEIKRIAPEVKAIVLSASEERSSIESA